MICRKDAVAAKEGMERYRGQDMQLRVSLYHTVCESNLMMHNRPDGASGSDLAIAAIIQAVSASFPFKSSLTLTANGC